MEKMLLKISGIIALIVGIGWCFTIIGIIIGVLLIIGGSTVIGYSNMSDNDIREKKGSILSWSIFFLFFTLVGGVLGIAFYLMMDNKLFVKKDDYISEIKKLDGLRKEGIISDAEYEAKKKQILDL